MGSNETRPDQIRSASAWSVEGDRSTLLFLWKQREGEGERRGKSGNQSAIRNWGIGE